jgi:hypothetical protein
LAVAEVHLVKVVVKWLNKAALVVAVKEKMAGLPVIHLVLYTEQRHYNLQVSMEGTVILVVMHKMLEIPEVAAEAALDVKVLILLVMITIQLGAAAEAAVSW